MRKTRIFKAYAALVMAVLAVVFGNCSGDEMAATQRSEEHTVIIPTGIEVETSLTHSWDSLHHQPVVTDEMKAELDVWRVVSGERTDHLYSGFKEPYLVAEGRLSQRDYAITEDQLNIKPTSQHIARASESLTEMSLEKDTVYFNFADAQVFSIPVEISNYGVTVGDRTYEFPSVTLESAKFVSLTNVEQATTRAQYVKAHYTTTYKALLNVKEKNVSSPKTFNVPVVISTTRHLLADDEVDSVRVENKKRVIIDETTERGSFDIVSIYKSGEKTRVEKAVIMKRLFAGIPPYEKTVSSFGYRFDRSNGQSSGTEVKNRTENGFEIYRKTDGYSADLVNGTPADKVVTDYSFMHERAVYDHDGVVVEFDYLPITVKEISTKVIDKASDRSGYKAADLVNSIETTYSGFKQNLSETVNLYMESKGSKYEILNTRLTVYPDSVVADLDFITKPDGGAQKVEHQHIKLPVSLICTTDWESVQRGTTHDTDEDAEYRLKEEKEKTEGYWSYVNETRVITTHVKLHDKSDKINSWTSIVPNSISYSREGVSATFDKIEWSVAHKGDKLVQIESAEAFDRYKYTDEIKVTYGNKEKSSAAPGLIKVSQTDVDHYEITDHSQSIEDDAVKVSVTFATFFVNGKKSIETFAKEFPRSRKVLSNWSSKEDKADASTGAASFVLLESNPMSDGAWSYASEKRVITTVTTLSSSKQDNKVESIDPNKIVFAMEGQKYEFGEIVFSSEEKGQDLKKSAETATEATYDFTDKISVKYGDNTVTLTAPGKLTVAKEATLQGESIKNAQLTITSNNVKATLTIEKKFTDGTSKEENVVKNFARSLKPVSDWKSKEANFSSTTGAANVTLSKSDNKTDGEWSYVSETRSIVTNAKLNASTQKNEWQSIDPNKIVFKRGDLTHDFGTISFSTDEAGQNVVKKSETATSILYGYTDKVNVKYGDNTASSTAPGTIEVEKTKEVTITGYSIKDPKLTITNDNVQATLKYVTEKSDGSSTEENVSKNFARSRKVLSNWSSNEDNSNATTGAAGVNLSKSDNKTDGEWKYVVETRSITTNATLNASTQKNEVQSIDPNKIVFERNGVKHDFGTIDFSATEAGQNVTKSAETATLITYSYTDKISMTYGDNTVSSNTPGTIKVAVAVTVTGYSIKNPKLVINDNNVEASLIYVTEKSDGSSTEETMSKSFNRSLKPVSNWSSIEDDNTHSTGAAATTLTKSDNKTDGDWKYVAETRKITTKATLKSSTQTNEWQSVEPNKIVFSKNGKSHDFGTIAFEATEAGDALNSNGDTHNYTDKISVKYGDNTISSVASGKIIVWKPDFPASYGKFVSVKFTNARNSTNNGSVHVASVHFEHGTLPLIIEKNASAPTVNLSWFTSETVESLNSATWIKSSQSWVNTIAEDNSDCMVWTHTNGKNADNMPYPTATAWGWDGGAKVSGHPSVTTKAFHAVLSENNSLLQIYKGDKLFATYKSVK